MAFCTSMINCSSLYLPPHATCSYTIVIPQPGNATKSLHQLSSYNLTKFSSENIHQNPCQQITLPPSLIHNDQVGFIQFRQAKDNVRHIMNLIDVVNKINTEVLLLRLNTKKTFYALFWIYITTFLCQIGIGGLFLQDLSALYFTSSAEYPCHFLF